MAKDKARIRAVYFDLDDTLCAYWEASKTGLRKAFATHGPAGQTPEEMMQHWASAFREFSPTLKQSGWYEGYCVSGEPTRTEQMRLTLKRAGVNDAELAAELSESYRYERDAALKLFPETLAVLEILRREYALGLITNGPADIQREEIATLGLDRFFTNVFIEGEMREGKPLPAVFARAAKAVRCEPQEILFVGNSYAHDVRPALDAGWHAVWIRRTSDVPPSTALAKGKAEQMPEGAPMPDAVITDLREILDFLGLHDTRHVAAGVRKA